METLHCENCGGVVGNLETPNVYEDHVVCAACHRRLNRGRRTPVVLLVTILVLIFVVLPVTFATVYSHRHDREDAIMAHWKQHADLMVKIADQGTYLIKMRTAALESPYATGPKIEDSLELDRLRRKMDEVEKWLKENDPDVQSGRIHME